MNASQFPTLLTDPCPGDPDEVEILAAKWQDAAFLLSEVALRLDGTDTAQANWKGKAADAFRDKINELRATIGKFRSVCESNSGLLNQWASRLREFQFEARALETAAASTDEARRRTAASTTPPAPGQPTLDDLKAKGIGFANRADELHDRYLEAARSLAARTTSLVDLPPGTKGWYGQRVDALQETVLMLAEIFRPGGPVPKDPALRAAWYASGYGGSPNGDGDIQAMYEPSDPGGPAYSQWGDPLTVTTINGRECYIDVNGVPHPIRSTGDTDDSQRAFDYMNEQLDREGLAYDPKTKSGSQYLFQDDSKPLVPKGPVSEGVAGTTADLIKVTWDDGQIVSIESVDATTTDRTGASSADINSIEQTINNKLPGGRKNQTENVVFTANSEEQAEAVADRFKTNPNVRVLLPDSGYDSGELGYQDPTDTSLPPCRGTAASNAQAAMEAEQEAQAQAQAQAQAEAEAEAQVEAAEAEAEAEALAEAEAMAMGDE